MSPVRKRRLIRDGGGGGSAARISNKLRPPDSGGGARLTTIRTKIPPAETKDRGGIPDEYVCFPLALEPVDQLVIRSARRRLTWLDGAVGVFAVMIGVILEPGPDCEPDCKPVCEPDCVHPD